MRKVGEVGMKEWICEEVPALTMDGKVVSTMLHHEQELVRCKACKWRFTNACFCKAKDDVQDEWFCSEGERKSD